MTLLLVAPSADEEAALRAHFADCSAVLEADLDEQLGAAVDAVVVGSRAQAAVAVVQRVHRTQPLCGVVVLTAAEDDAGVRRSVMYAPDMPASLTVHPVDNGDDTELVEVVAAARAAGRSRRAHAQTLAALGDREPTARSRALAPASLGALLDHAPFGVLVGDLDGHLVSWNRWAADFLGVGDDAVGSRVSALFPSPEPVDRAFVAARAGAESSATVVLDSPGETSMEVSTVPTRLENGDEALLVLVADVTVRRRAELTRDRLAEHVGLLSRVSEALAGTLEVHTALEHLVEEVVPGLADWVSVQTYDSRGRLGRVVVHHRNRRHADVAARFQDALAAGRGPSSPSRRGVGGGEPVLLPRVDAEQLAGFLTDRLTRGLAEEMGVSGVIAVPLPGRTETSGSMVLVRTDASPTYTTQDLAAATEVGRRAGVALETASLYAHQRDLAEELQRSLLTDPPETEDSEIEVRYVPAAQEAQVGGDWYDAFVQADGATVLVIGDVMGHDTRAAAAMGQLRALLRGIGYTTGTGPAEMLSRLDAAIEGLRLHTTATGLVVRLSPPALNGEPSDPVELCWSNAGHPPPIVLEPGGVARTIETTEPDLLLGVLAHTDRQESPERLERGGTLLLYTDGLIERRGLGIDEGLAALTAAVEKHGHLPLGAMCDEVLAELLPDEHDDDVALVAVRLRTADPDGGVPQ
jgi:PAS domain-containing protein